MATPLLDSFLKFRTKFRSRSKKNNYMSNSKEGEGTPSLLDDQILRLIVKYLYYPTLPSIRCVCRKLASFFSPSSLLQRGHLAIPNGVEPLVFAQRVQLLLYSRLWPVEELRKQVPFWRLSQAVERFVQGSVAKIQLQGSVRNGTIVGTVEASLKSKCYTVTCCVVNGQCEVPTCQCVTGYVLL